ncbi:Hypothetical predicted protein [Octopus vulgaris]|uniref:Uncharacterized protein n=1 Tax=Octopus vulgaris TaxID=6645 RepID=A0AA36F4T6_OCTVU|nr:Hypothetical predicted protein [Octopus vulgaris]
MAPLLTLPEHTTGAEIYKAAVNEFSSRQIDISKVDPGKTLDVMFGDIKAFEMKLEVLKRHVDNERFRYFPNLKRCIIDLSKDDRTKAVCKH